MLKNSEEQSIINSILKIEKNCFSDSWSESSIRQELLNDNAHWACSFYNGFLIGYGLIWIVAGDCQLLRLAVHPDYRRLGVGYKILDFLVEYAKYNSCESIFLEVRKSNIAAINLYENFEFKNIGVRKEYYMPEKEDALLYIKEFT